MAQDLLTDDALRARLVAEASEHVLRFDWAEVARETVGVYERLVTARRRRDDRVERKAGEGSRSPRACPRYPSPFALPPPPPRRDPPPARRRQRPALSDCVRTEHRTPSPSDHRRAQHRLLT